MWFYWYWKCRKWTTRRGGSVLKIWVVISLMKPILNQKIPVVTKTYIRLMYQYVRIKGIWETNQGSLWNLCLPLYLVNVYLDQLPIMISMNVNYGLIYQSSSWYCNPVFSIFHFTMSHFILYITFASCATKFNAFMLRDDIICFAPPAPYVRCTKHQ